MLFARRALPLSLLSLFLPIQARATPERHVVEPWYRITESGGRLHTRHETLILRVHERLNRSASFYVLEQRSTRHAGRWIDGRLCPPLAKIMGDLEPARARFKQRHDWPLPSGDMGGAQLEGPLRPNLADSETLSDFVGPVAIWWAEAKAALDPCWTDKPILIDGKPLVSLSPS